MEAVVALGVLLVLAALAIPVLLVLSLVEQGNLRRRVSELERSLAMLCAAQQVQAAAPASPMKPQPMASPAPAARVPPVAPSVPPLAVPASSPVPAQAAASVAPPRVPPTPAPAPRPPRPPAPPAPPGVFERLASAVRRWFTEGNVPVKVGVLVLLAAVAALLKYASDQGWLTLPIGLRLAAVAAAALAALAFAWRTRETHRSFALAVQGGAIGVLLLVVFAAARLYAMLPMAAAFGLSVVLVAALGVLALLQHSRTLAVLGILAGFLAPIWLSTGEGSHVVLFSYYALLNAAIFAIAWLRPWRELNLLGWVFTWGIGVAWGVLAYSPDKYATTQPFLLLFFAFYLLIPILYARRRTPGRRDIVDGGLLFGTPLVAFLLQARLLEGERMPLALCAVVVAVVYAGLWWWQRRGPHAVLAEAYALLAMAFATLAVPLALSAGATAAVFAVEGAALVWLGLRQDRGLQRWAGAGLQLAAAVAYVVGFVEGARTAPVIANPVFAGAMLLALSGFASAWWQRAAERTLPAAIAYGWGLAWWCTAIVAEVGRHVDPGQRPDALLVAVALTALLAGGIHGRRPAPALALTVLGAFLLAALLAVAQFDDRGQLLAGWGLVAWALFAGLGVGSLLGMRDGGGAVVPWAQFTWWLLWPLVLSLAALAFARSQELGDGWRLALPMLPWMGLMVLAAIRWPWLRWPLAEEFDDWRGSLLTACLAVVGCAWLVALVSPGGSAPLPWLPLLNPLDLVQLAALALLASWMRSGRVESRQQRIAVLVVAGVALATCITLRGVHHWGGVAWGQSLWSSELAQTALTVVWSVMGVAGWVWGSRRGQRALWLAGAVLMALVLAKLVLVDRQHLGNLLGIGSFMAFGLLCTLVGWLAPAPPVAPPGPGDELQEEGVAGS